MLYRFCSENEKIHHYRYDTQHRLVHTTSTGLDITLPYATDPAGNWLPDPEFYPQSRSTVWADNRITEDAQYLYRYDRYGRLTEKTDRIPEGVIRMNDERTHRYDYDSRHRLVHYVRTQYGETQAESRYVYDPSGRRISKRMWRRERSLAGYMALTKTPDVTWYGWECDRLVTVQKQESRIQTVYAPGSFTPLVRIETDNAGLAKAKYRSLAEKLQQEGSGDGQVMQFPAMLVQMLDRLEGELRQNAVSEESRAWLAQCGLTPERMAGQLEPRHEPERKIHLYHCDHRGLPLALISPDNTVAWRAEYDEWGNLLGEENPAHLEQLIRLPGQQYDEESGLYYNRHRYYNPGLRRYITQDPIGLEGGLNPYTYPLNPVEHIDPLGLADVTPQMMFGANFYNTMQGANVGFVPNLSDEERAKALDNFSNMRGIYDPMDKYIQGWVYGSALYASVSLAACSSPAFAMSGALTGGANALNQIWNGGNFSFSDVYMATNAGILTEGRGLLATIGINFVGYSISNMIKGATQTKEGAVATVFGSVIGFGAGKVVGTVANGTTTTATGAVITEMATSTANENLNE